MQINLANKTILVTGASDGIGKAIAHQLLASGARVGIHYRSNEAAAAELASLFPEQQTHLFQADFANQKEVISLWQQVCEAFGKVDAIVQNAGVYLPHGLNTPIEEWMERWHNVMSINLHSAGILSRLGIEHFRKNGGGRFVYIASRAAFRGETDDFLGYAASKGGMVSLARSVARSFGKDNIKAFTIAPGFTKTPMTTDIIEEIGEEKILGELALDTLTTPEDIAPTVALLCSGLADHATGTTIDFNAGSYMR